MGSFSLNVDGERARHLVHETRNNHKCNTAHGNHLVSSTLDLNIDLKKNSYKTA